MSDEKATPSGGKVLSFPMANEAETGKGAWEQALQQAVLSPLREGTARQAAVVDAGGDHEAVEARLRLPETRRHVAVAAKARLTELIPLAVKRLAEAVEERESWAIKLLLDAIGFGKLAEGMLEDTGEESEPIISTAFEREFVENMPDSLRNPTAAKAGEDASER